MDKALVKDRSHMLVLQGIVDHLSIPAVLHQPGLPEGPQLVGNGGLAHAQKGGNVADAHFGPQKGADDFNPGGIAENLKQVRQIQQKFIIGHCFPDFGYHFLVDDITLTAFSFYNALCHAASLSVE
jgi:hypothetical protein